MIDSRPDRTIRIKKLVGKRLCEESSCIFCYELSLNSGYVGYDLLHTADGGLIASLDEFPFQTRIADIISLKTLYNRANRYSEATIYEVKSCKEDYLTDNKWRDYLPWCNKFFFAVDEDFPLDIIDCSNPQVGVVVANDITGFKIKRSSKSQINHPIFPIDHNYL